MSKFDALVAGAESAVAAAAALPDAFAASVAASLRSDLAVKKSERDRVVKERDETAMHAAKLASLALGARVTRDVYADRAVMLRAEAAQANERNRAIDALTIAAQHDECALASDLAAVGSLCVATRREEPLWAALARVPHGPLKRTALMYAAKTGDFARVRFLIKCCSRASHLDALSGPNDLVLVDRRRADDYDGCLGATGSFSALFFAIEAVGVVGAQRVCDAMGALLATGASDYQLDEPSRHGHPHNVNSCLLKQRSKGIDNALVQTLVNETIARRRAAEPIIL